MYRSVLSLFVLLSIVLPAKGQFRAIQSSAGGAASSPSYSTRATIGEPVEGLAVISNQDTLITGFYLVIMEGGGEGDNQGPRIFFVEIGNEAITPLSEVPPDALVQPENVAIPVATQITDVGSGVDQATLFYRRGGTASFTQQVMNLSDNRYTGTIEAAMVDSTGLEYYIVANDNLNNISRNPSSGTHDIQVRIDSPGLQRSFAGDTLQTGYRLIAVPMDLANKASSNVLSDLGTYDNRFWRLWELKEDYAEFSGDEQYNELRNGTAFNPGDAFWLISRQDWTFQTGQATSLQTSEPFTKTLHAGWNFISNPFSFPIPLQNISLSSSTTPDPKRYLRGWASASTLNPFVGYAIDAGVDDNVILTIDPNLGGVGGKQSGEPVTEINSFTWGIRIMAESPSASDRDNYIAVSNEASTGWDLLDRPEPPVIGDYVSVSFPHSDWGKIHKRYEADVRPTPAYGDQWQFDVTTGSPQVVQLSFEGIDEVPPQFSIQLIDEVTKTTLDLREHHTYTVRTAEAGQVYPLSVSIGESGYIDEQVESKNLLPDTPTLDQNYPNPFNPTTSIRYGLKSPSIVTLEVYNSLGQVVSTLVNSVSKDAGYHVATWDALADDGSAVSSGLYLYRLSVTPDGGSSAAQPSVLTRKMMLIK